MSAKRGQLHQGPSIGQYGTKKGALRVLEILEEFSLKSTWFIPANIVMEHPDVVEKILDLGHEIGHHGLDHTGAYGATFEEQRGAYRALPGDFLKIYRAQGGGLSAHGRAASGDGVDLLGGRFCVLQRRNQRRGMQLVRGGGEPTHAVNIPCRDEQMDDYVQTVFHSYPAVLVGMPRIAPYENAYPTGSARWRAWCAWAIPVLRRFTRRLRGLRAGGGISQLLRVSGLQPGCGARPA